MSLESGQITTSDLSANAGILGNQIADGTIETRNLAAQAIQAFQIQNGDVFKIVQSGQISLALPSSTTTVQTNINHNLGFFPAYLIYMTTNPSSGRQYSNLPVPLSTANVSGFVVYAAWIYAYATDANNITIKIEGVDSTKMTSLVGTYNFQYFLLQESLQ